MGVIKRGILGGFSGKVAGIVGSSWKGIAVVKSRPLSVANPKTSAQMAQRNKFSQCTKAASLLLINVCKTFWDWQAQFMSGYNDFVKRNVDNFDADGVSNLAGIVISPGKYPETVPTLATMTAAQTQIQITWEDDSEEGEKLGTDKALMVLYNEDTNVFYSQKDGSDRSTEAYTFLDLPPLVQGQKWSVWLAFHVPAKKTLKFKAGSDLSGTVQ